MKEGSSNSIDFGACMTCTHFPFLFKQIKNLKSYAEHGKKFRSGHPCGSQDELQKLIEKVFLQLAEGKNNWPKAKEIFNSLPINLKPIFKKDKTKIYWKNSKGHEKMTTFKMLQNRITSIRKKFRENP